HRHHRRGEPVPFHQHDPPPAAAGGLPKGGRAGVSARTVVRGALLTGLLLAAGCRFEKRPDLAAREPVDSTLYMPAGDDASPLEDSVRATITAVDEAFRVSDVARVAQLT